MFFQKHRIKLVLLLISSAVMLTACGTDTEGEESIGASVDYTITGIEPGAGTTALAKQMLEDYQLTDYELLEASTAAMIASLNEAISNEEPILVTGWTPHWKFAMHDLKFLDDPKESFGGVESIHTIARLGLEEDMPEAYTILDRFYWETEDMEEVMLMTHEAGLTFEEAAVEWIEANPDTVEEWTNGVAEVSGETIEIVLTPWDTELASTAVVTEVLERQGYRVVQTPVDPSVLFQALAIGDVDASTAPWLPATHGMFYEEYKDNLDDLGSNLDGAKIGIVVPIYMDIDSIEDLQ